MIQGESFNNVAVAENIPHNQNKNLSLVCHCLPQSTTHRGPKPSHIGHSMLHNYFFKRKKKTKLKLNIFTLAHTYLQLSLIILIG